MTEDDDKDLLNRKFGKLTIIEKCDRKDKSGCLFFKCRCDCGQIKEIAIGNLKSGGTKSCGCLRKQCNNLTYSYGPKHRCWCGYKGILGSFWKRIKNNAAKRNIPINITIEDCWNLWILQEGKCRLTGLEITLPKDTIELRKAIATASLDRIDSSKGYIKGNIQWVHKDINIMKSNHNQEEFIKLCSFVYKHNYNIDLLIDDKPFK